MTYGTVTRLSPSEDAIDTKYHKKKTINRKIQVAWGLFAMQMQGSFFDILVDSRVFALPMITRPYRIGIVSVIWRCEDSVTKELCGQICVRGEDIASSKIFLPGEVLQTYGPNANNLMSAPPPQSGGRSSSGIVLLVSSRLPWRVISRSHSESSWSVLILTLVVSFLYFIA